MLRTLTFTTGAVAIALVLAGCQSDAPTGPAAVFTLSSTAFKEGDAFPSRYACPAGVGAIAGTNSSPPLAWSNEPKGTQSVAIVLDDPDAPTSSGQKATFTHWITWGIAPGTLTLPAGSNGPSVGDNDLAPLAPSLGLPQSVYRNYFGACPPPASGTHRYIFRAYALSSPLTLAAGASRSAFDAAIAGKVLAEARVTTTVNSNAP